MIKTIAWVSKDRDELLRRSVESFQRSPEATRRELSYFVAGTNSNNKIAGLNYIDKEKLYHQLVEKTAELGVPSEIISFALLGDKKLTDLSIRDTGTNRNALLLSLIGQVFLSADDDILCQFASTQDELESGVLFDSNLRSRISEFFLNKKECLEAIDYPEENKLSEFLLAHEQLLNMSDQRGKVAATISGIHGDSGCGSPRDLLLMNFSEPQRYEAGIKNKLMLRYVEQPVITNRPFFMTMCAGIDNRMMLPPFFPLGRNQDGVFASTLKACLPNTLVGYIPWVVRHDPFPPREYPDGEVRIWRFRISELINLLLENFSKIYQVDNSSPDFERYELVGKYLENFAKQEPQKFLESLRNLCAPNISAYGDYLQRLAISNNRRPPSQTADLLVCSRNIEMIKKQETFCVPEELLVLENTEEAIIVARDLVFKYGTLLRFWPTIRRVA